MPLHLGYIDQCTHHHLCESKSQFSKIRSLSFPELNNKMQTYWFGERKCVCAGVGGGWLGIGPTDSYVNVG